MNRINYKKEQHGNNWKLNVELWNTQFLVTDFHDVYFS